MGTSIEVFTFPMVQHWLQLLNHAVWNQRRDIFSPYIPGLRSLEVCVFLRPPQDCLDARQELQIKNHKHFRALNPKTFSPIRLEPLGTGMSFSQVLEGAWGTVKGPLLQNILGSHDVLFEAPPKSHYIHRKQPLESLPVSHRSQKVNGVARSPLKVSTTA